MNRLGQWIPVDFTAPQELRKLVLGHLNAIRSLAERDVDLTEEVGRVLPGPSDAFLKELLISASTARSALGKIPLISVNR